jgi:hypothetical protein
VVNVPQPVCLIPTRNYYDSSEGKYAFIAESTVAKFFGRLIELISIVMLRRRQHVIVEKHRRPRRESGIVTY